MNRHFLIPLFLLCTVAPFLVSYANTPGRSSLADLGDRALHAGDYKTAIELYSKWLEADPGDYLHWYNYACALSMANQKEQALRALEDAVESGFRDCKWAAQDLDLASLHENQEFEALLKRMRELKQAESELAGGTTVTLFAEQTKFSPFRLIIPEGEPSESGYPVVILLHSRTHDETEMAEMAVRLALPGVAFVLPRAPFSISGDVTGFEYWPTEGSGTCDTSVIHQSVVSSSDWYQNILSETSKKIKVDDNRIYIGGYGQGAEMACLTALATPHTFNGCFMAGGMIDSTFVNQESFSKLEEHPIPFYITYGSRDRMFSHGPIEHLKEISGKWKSDFKFKDYPIGHELADEMIVGISDWLIHNGILNHNRR